MGNLNNILKFSRLSRFASGIVLAWVLRLTLLAPAPAEYFMAQTHDVILALLYIWALLIWWLVFIVQPFIRSAPAKR